MANDNVEPAEFRRILDNEGGERAVAKYLCDNPEILYWTLCPSSGHARYVFCEFPLGSQYNVDVVILNSYSGTWEVYFVELEPVHDPVYTKAGIPSQRLAGAIKQLDDWREYVQQNPDAVRRDLVRWAMERDKLGYTKREPVNRSGDRLADSRTVILYRYQVVIGRSSKHSAEVRALAGRHALSHSQQVVSYDRLLHLVERRYEGKRDTT